MRHLFAWDEDRLIGRFDQDDAGRIRFEYAPGCPDPISLSLPLAGSWKEAAPRHFLEGLLPDQPTERLRMQVALHAATTDTFDLLESVDSSGGLVFTSSDDPPQPTGPAGIHPIMSDDIAAQMERIWVSSDAWWKPDKHNRFSLAGSQGKFSVVIRNGLWFWPSANLPSTHIIKPDGRRVADVAEVEHATLELASTCGIDVPKSDVITFCERTGLIIERFDRIVVDGVAHRLRAEDLAQAMGIAPDDKYEPEMADVISCLRNGGVSDGVLYAFVRQAAFNAAVGNSDAHAKNYSLVYTGGGARLSPLYDAICMAHWSQFKHGTLAMPINGVYDPWEIAWSDWRSEATLCRLDPDVVEGIVREVVDTLRAQDYRALPCRESVAREIESYVCECTRDLR